MRPCKRWIMAKFVKRFARLTGIYSTSDGAIHLGALLFKIRISKGLSSVGFNQGVYNANSYNSSIRPG